MPKPTNATRKVRKNKTNPTRHQIIKQQCSFQPFPMAKKDALKMSELRKNTQSVRLQNVDTLLAEYRFDKEQKTLLKSKLNALEFNIRFKGDFYERLDANGLWLLSCMYNKDIKQIKEHLLTLQARSILASIGKGYMNIEDF